MTSRSEHGEKESLIRSRIRAGKVKKFVLTKYRMLYTVVRIREDDKCKALVI